MTVIYTKSQRSQAKEEKSGLFTIDIDERANNGPRITVSGLASEKRIAILQKMLSKFVKGE